MFIKRYALFINLFYLNNFLYVFAFLYKEIRTNNDVEGWHNLLRTLIRENSPFYELVAHLHRSAQHVDVEVRGLSQGNNSTHRESKKTQVKDEKLLRCWNIYQHSDNAFMYLDELVKIVRPSYRINMDILNGLGDNDSKFPITLFNKYI